MEITEVRVKLMDDTDDRLRAFCSITFDDCFVVRDLKIIDGTNGPFVAMPSRKLTSRCDECGAKNHLRARYCNECGIEFEEEELVPDADGRVKLYADIAHPINSRCREMIQTHVISEYQRERELAHQPGYKSRYDDGYTEDSGPDDDDFQEQVAGSKPVAGSKQVAGSQQTVKTQFDQGQPLPPPPHRPPDSSPTDAGDHQPATNKHRDFGAGIFDQ